MASNEMLMEKIINNEHEISKLIKYKYKRIRKWKLECKKCK